MNIFLLQDKINASGGGPRQRSEALAALNSAFNSSSGPKTTSTRPSGRSQGGGSQRAAAVAALSQVLTAEKKQGSDSPTAVHSRSPTSEDHFSGKRAPLDFLDICFLIEDLNSLHLHLYTQS